MSGSGATLTLRVARTPTSEAAMAVAARPRRGAASAGGGASALRAGHAAAFAAAKLNAAVRCALSYTSLSATLAAGTPAAAAIAQRRLGASATTASVVTVATLKLSAAEKRAGASGEGVGEGVLVLPFVAVVVPVEVPVEVLVLVAVAGALAEGGAERVPAAPAPLADSDGVCRGEAGACKEEEGAPDAVAAPLSGALCENNGLAESPSEGVGLPLKVAKGEGVKRALGEALGDCLPVLVAVRDGAAVRDSALAVAASGVAVRDPVDAALPLSPPGVTVRVALPSSDAVCCATVGVPTATVRVREDTAEPLPVGRPPLGVPSEDRVSEGAAESEPLAVAEPQEVAEAEGLPLPLAERAGVALALRELVPVAKPEKLAEGVAQRVAVAVVEAAAVAETVVQLEGEALPDASEVTDAEPVMVAVGEGEADVEAEGEGAADTLALAVLEGEPEALREASSTVADTLADTVRLLVPDPEREGVLEAQPQRVAEGETEGEEDEERDGTGVEVLEVVALPPVGLSDALAQPVAEAVALASAVAEALGDRECSKSAPRSTDTLPAALTLHVLGRASGQEASKKPTQLTSRYKERAYVSTAGVTLREPPSRKSRHAWVAYTLPAQG